MTRHDGIVRTTEIVFDSLQDMRERGRDVWNYDPEKPLAANLSNPTVRKLEKALTELEDGVETLAVQTGQAAISTVLLTYACSGGTILLPDNVYGPVRLFCENQLAPFKAKAVYYNPLSVSDLQEKISDNVKLLYIESPGSHTFETADISALAACAKMAGIPVAMDNTFYTPYGLQPLNNNVDVVLHSLSKIISGTASVYGGSLTVRDIALYRILKNMAVFLGHWLSPDDANTILTGLGTLEQRLKSQKETMEAIIAFLKSRPEIEDFYLAMDKNAAGASLFSFVFRPDITERQVAVFLESCRVFKMSLGWGGPTSLMVPVNPASSRTMLQPRHQGQMIRVYVGQEKVEILLEDLDRAFAAMAYPGR